MPHMRNAAWCALALALTATACASSAAQTAPSGSSPSPVASGPKPFPSVPSIQECRKALHSPCYTPDVVRTAYGIDKLNRQGLTGKGRVIAIYDQFVPPSLERDLEKFSEAMNLPKPELTIRKINSGGSAAPFDAANESMAAGAMETTLDVQMAHMMAPDAKIVVGQLALPKAPPNRPDRPLLTHMPSKEAKESGEGMAELFAGAFAEMVKQDSPDVISVSYSAQEYQAAGNTHEPVAAFEKASKVFADLVGSGVTLVSGAGDWGAAPTIGEDGKRVRSTSWPGSDPAFLSLGGSRLHLDADGKRTGPDTVWNDSTARGGATGGGPSQTFRRPAYQESVRDVVGDRRGTSDVSMDGSASGGTLIYQSFLPAGAGWLPLGGTSESTPLFAAVVALAGEKAGKRLGDIHDELYELAQDPKGGIVDITEGDNGPDGFEATKGYDLASGLGTVDAARFVPALAAAVS
ncbi:S53 family peptidase [Streptomyces flavofungini]|uniref:S53 family peptidase n=1 Tax=Streptomyces flavofungini TaxID=68200 RepID=UPI0025AFD4E5|nr:S53 family peptidase [Streptomyces flavofungini]WJV51638.1 S53 family peptidase [Streptomyces flavofungini]